MILSASTDSRIKLWRFDEQGARLAGVLGEWPGWSLSDESTFEAVTPEVAEGGAGGREGSAAEGSARGSRQARAGADGGGGEGGGGGKEGGKGGGSGSDESDASDDSAEDDHPLALAGRRRAGGGLHHHGGGGSGGDSTQQMINKILSRSSTRDPLRRTAAHTKYRLKTHDLTEVMPSPRSNSASPRVSS